MSTKYPGGIISKTAPTPSGPYSTDTAPGVWTLEQQAYWQKLGQWPTQGNVNPSAFIENLFSTYLYTGTGAAQTITNGIDLSTNGGLVWGKNRDGNWSHYLADTAQGTGKFLQSNTTSATQLDSTSLTAFNANGFSIGNAGAFINNNGVNYASWTFRKQAKFFDVVTYTGNGGTLTVNHSLASSPGCIIIKRTSNVASWMVYHRSLTDPTRYYLSLNLTNAQADWGSTWITATSTSFTLSGANGLYNGSGDTYVAYLFAHDAGGFGLTGTDNVISCGSYTGTSDYEGPVVNLGFEPQWLLIKSAGSVKNWVVLDNMRGLTAGGDNEGYLVPNTSDQEYSGTLVKVNATGFQASGSSMVAANGVPYIYIAIRRGPMKVPTSGTSVFSPVTATAPASPYTVATNFPVDLTINCTTSSSLKSFNDRLRGGTTNSYVVLRSTSTAAEFTGSGFGIGFDSNTSIIDNAWQSGYGTNPVYWNFRRAPGFFDEVCWSSTGSAQTLNHNLGVVPELMIRKVRNGTWESWMVYAAPIGNTKILYLDQTAAEDTNNGWNNQTPTATQFFVNNTLSGYNFVTYLFATCAGVSKVGSYTGTGTTLQVDCGFTGGSRFVMIKRTDSTGDWYVWDSARGIVAGNDPYLLLNSTAAEVTGTDYVDTYSAGFEISSTAPSAINASGGTFIFLAIA